MGDIVRAGRRGDSTALESAGARPHPWLRATRGALVSLAVLTAACASSPAPVRGNPDAEWTLLVYMAADDDLESAALRNLLEMAEVGSTGAVNVIVQIDRAGATKNGRGFLRAPLLNLPDFSSTKRLRVDRGRVLELADLGETSTGEAETLRSFVAWGLTTFPARKTALVLWDHGGATSGFGWDVTNDDKGLGIREMHRGIAEGLGAAGRPRFDLVGFDACLMANLAIAYELRDVASVFVGSEEVEPAHGWAYAPVLRAMQANASPHGLAKEIVGGFEAACHAARTTDYCTLAAFETAKLEPVAAALDELGDRLERQTKVATDWYPLARARAMAEQYGEPTGDHSRYSVVDAVDYAAGAARALGEPNHVEAAVAAATIVAFHGGGRPRAHGLSLTFPRRPEDSVASDAALELSGRARWHGFLRAYLAQAGADKTAPEVRSLVAIPSEEALELRAEILGDDVAETVAMIGIPDPSGVVSMLAVQVLPHGASSYRWKKRLPWIGDGTVELPVTLFEGPTYRDATGDRVKVATMAAMLHPHGDANQAIDVVVYVRLPHKLPPSILGMYRFTGGGPAGEVELHPDDRLAPMVKTVAVDGTRSWTPSKQTLAVSDRTQKAVSPDVGGIAHALEATGRLGNNLRIAERVAPPGQYAVGFRVTDYAGNRRLDTTRVTLP